jgi:hypothetical protein
MSVKLSEDDEQRLRNLAVGLAQNIRTPDEILTELGFSEDDWRLLERSRTFKRMLEQAQAEWNAAGSTHKRVKLKAGINIELSLPQFYQDMVDVGHPLGARVRLLEAMTTLAGMPQQEAAKEQAPGAQFKLEIHLGGDRVDVVSIGASAIPASPVLDQRETLKLPDWLLDPNAYSEE